MAEKKSTPIRWHPDAEARLQRVLFFVRPLARRRAEREAQRLGLPEVTPELLEALRKQQHDGAHRVAASSRRGHLAA